MKTTFMVIAEKRYILVKRIPLLGDKRLFSDTIDL